MTSMTAQSIAYWQLSPFPSSSFIYVHKLRLQRWKCNKTKFDVEHVAFTAATGSSSKTTCNSICKKSKGKAIPVHA